MRGAIHQLTPYVFMAGTEINLYLPLQISEIFVLYTDIYDNWRSRDGLVDIDTRLSAGKPRNLVWIHNRSKILLLSY